MPQLVPFFSGPSGSACEETKEVVEPPSQSFHEEKRSAFG